MFHTANFHTFTRAHADTTIFHRDGSRTVIGELATIRYAPDGTATIVASALPSPTDTLRWDLAA